MSWTNNWQADNPLKYLGCGKLSVSLPGLSNADFVSKITIVEEESDETLFWLELIVEANLLKKEKIKGLIKEADELTAIFTASGKTARNNNPKSKFRNQNEYIDIARS